MSSVLGVHWKDWCWGWNSNTLVTWCEELTHLKRPWCWETLKVGGEGDNRGWDGWMASPTWCTWVWVSSVSWWWTGKLGELQFMESQRIKHDWMTKLNWYIFDTPKWISQAFMSKHYPITLMTQSFFLIDYQANWKFNLLLNSQRTIYCI